MPAAKLPPQQFFLVVAVPSLGAAYVFVSMGAYFAFRDTFERDAANELSALYTEAEKAKNAQDKGSEVEACQKILARVGDHKLTKPQLTKIRDYAAQVVQQHVAAEQAEKAETARRQEAEAEAARKAAEQEKLNAAIRAAEEKKAAEAAAIRTAQEKKAAEAAAAAKLRVQQDADRQKQDAEGRKEEELKQACGVINGWLESQRKGGTGAEYWNPEFRDAASSLMNVSSWQIQRYLPPKANAKNTGKMMAVQVRVSSTNRGGQPIVQTWTITLHSPFDATKWSIGFVGEGTLSQSYTDW